MISAQEEWNSLYTDEIESIWKSEHLAFRKPAMIYYVLTQELQKLQENLANKMKQFKHQIFSMEELEAKERQENVPMPLSENELSKSPTISKHRNISFNRRIPKLNLNLSKEHLPIKKENLDVDIIESSPEVSFNQTKLKEVNKFFIPNNADMVDSSFIIDNTPVKSFIKKTNKKGVKRNQKTDKSSTLTQLFKTIPTSSSISNNTRLFNQTSPNCKKFDIKSKDVSDTDETFCDVKMETNTTSKAFKNTFKDYDKFPVARPKSPLFVHKTEPVRRKADRMKLPGWSCEDCRKFYESSNLTPEELREKMNACSKHRGKFEPLDETFAGYWDVEMFQTQDI